MSDELLAGFRRVLTIDYRLGPDELKNVALDPAEEANLEGWNYEKYLVQKVKPIAVVKAAERYFSQRNNFELPDEPPPYIFRKDDQVVEVSPILFGNDSLVIVAYGQDARD